MKEEGTLIVIDCETTGTNWVKDKVHRIGCLEIRVPSLSIEDFIYGPPTRLICGKVISRLRKAKIVCGHNIKFDAHFLKPYIGDLPWEKVYDTMVMARLFNDQEEKVSLLALSLKYLDYSGVEDAVVYLHSKKSEGYENIPDEVLEPYMRAQLEHTALLFFFFKPKLKGKQASLLEQERKLTRILFEMEERGVLVDINALEEAETFYKEEYKRKEAFLRKLAGKKDFNPLSPRQVADFLKGRINVPVTLKGNPSTSSSALLPFINMPEVEAILTCRKTVKMLSSYCQEFRERLDDNNCIHPNYLQAGTKTGRLSCKEPNLQNLPRSEGFYLPIRKMLVSREGYRTFSVDYKGIELRVAAGLAKDDKVIKLFVEGKDPHAYVQRVLGLGEGKTGRSVAKNLNFGILYGASVSRLSLMIEAAEKGLPAAMGKTTRTASAEYREKANDLLSRWRALFPGIANYVAALKRNLYYKGYVENPLGRRHYLPMKLCYKALNFVVQGTAADIAKLGMIYVDDVFKEHGGGNLLLQIHDEVVVEIEEDRVDELLPLVKDALVASGRKVFPYLPIEVDVEEWTPSWGEIKEIE